MNPDETAGQAAQPESQWPGLWDDLASVKALAEKAKGVPNLRHLAYATVALCQVVENLAQRVEALESPKPCEGCQEGRQAVAELLRVLANEAALNTESERGLLSRALSFMGWKAGT